MSYDLLWDDKARNFLRKIQRDDAKRIIRKVNSIVDDPQHYLETLVKINSYKLRIGDYRALIDIDESKKILSVVLIGHRKEIYKLIRRSGFRRK